MNPEHKDRLNLLFDMLTILPAYWHHLVEKIMTSNSEKSQQFWQIVYIGPRVQLVHISLTLKGRVNLKEIWTRNVKLNKMPLSNLPTMLTMLPAYCIHLLEKLMTFSKWKKIIWQDLSCTSNCLRNEIILKVLVSFNLHAHSRL